MDECYPEGDLNIFAQAFLIAFTSDFIQKLVYKYEFGERGTMKDYVMFTLSKSPKENWIDQGQVGVACGCHVAIIPTYGGLECYSVSDIPSVEDASDGTHVQ